jgi:hypothetical protein
MWCIYYIIHTRITVWNRCVVPKVTFEWFVCSSLRNWRDLEPLCPALIWGAFCEINEVLRIQGLTCSHKRSYHLAPDTVLTENSRSNVWTPSNYTYNWHPRNVFLPCEAVFQHKQGCDMTKAWFDGRICSSLSDIQRCEICLMSLFCDVWETVSGRPGIPTHMVWRNRWSRNNRPTEFNNIKAVIWPRHDLMGGSAPHSLTFKDVKYVSWAFLWHLSNDVEQSPILGLHGYFTLYNASRYRPPPSTPK